MVLQVENLTKKYKGHLAVDSVSFEMKPNTIYGLLGRNGAGKSTILNMISHRINKTSGDIRLDGMDLWKTQTALEQVYLTSDEDWFYSEYRIKKIFKLIENSYGSFDWDFANHLVEVYNLNIKKKLKSLSTGYRSIAKLIAALCVPANYVFLDEPVLGLDANHRQVFSKKLLEAYDRRPRTFVISTHIIEEVAFLLEEVIIIDKGKILVNGHIENLLKAAQMVAGPHDLVDSVTHGMKILGTDYLGNLKQVVVFGELPEELPAGVTVSNVRLQEYFVHVTKREGE